MLFPMAPSDPRALDTSLINTIYHAIKTLECLRHLIPIQRSTRGPHPGVALFLGKESPDLGTAWQTVCEDVSPPVLG